MADDEVLNTKVTVAGAEQAAAELNAVSEATTKVGNTVQQAGEKASSGASNFQKFTASLGAINAETIQAHASLQGFDQQLAGILAAAGPSAAALYAVASATQTVTTASTVATGATNTFGMAMQELGAHGRTLSLGLDAIGLQAGSAAARIAAAAEAFRVMGDVGIGPLLLIAGGLTAVILGLAAMKKALDEAGEWQQEMQILGATVKAQGGDWDTLQEKVTKFAEAMEQSTTFSRDEVVKSIQELAKLGVTGDDAMKTVQVGADAAAASGKSLEEVTHQLALSEEGRSRVLAEMGIPLSEIQAKTITLQDALDIINKRMGGDAKAAAEGYKGSLAETAHSIETLSQDLGAPLLGPLTAAIKGFTGFIEYVDQGFKDWLVSEKIWADQNKAVLADLGIVFKALGELIVDAFLTAWAIVTSTTKTAVNVIFAILNLLTGNWKAAWDDLVSATYGSWKNFLQAFGGFGDNIIEVASRIVTRVKELFSGLMEGASAIIDVMNGDLLGGKAKWDAAGQDLGKTFAGGLLDGLHHKWNDVGGAPWKAPDLSGLEKSLKLEHNPAIHEKKNKNSQGFNEGAPMEYRDPEKIDQVTQRELALKNTIDQLTESEEAYNIAVQDAITPQQKYNAELAEKMKISQDARAEQQLYNVDILAATQNNAQLRTELNAHKSVLQSLIESYNQHRAALEGNTKVTNAQKQNLAETRQHIEDLKKAIEEEAKEYKQNSTAIEENTRKRDALTSKANELQAFLSKEQEAYAGAVEKAQQASQDLKATYDKGINAQRAYYEQRLASLQVGEYDYWTLKAEYTKKLIELDDKYYEESQTYAKKIQESTQKAYDNEATYGKSITQQVAYWEQRLVEVQKGQTDEWTLRTQYADNILKLEEENWKKLQDEHKSFIASWQQREEQWLDGIIRGHKSIADTLKSIWKGIADDWTKSLETMIVSSGPFKSLNEALFGTGLGTSPPTKFTATTTSLGKEGVHGTKSELEKAGIDLQQGAHLTVTSIKEGMADFKQVHTGVAQKLTAAATDLTNAAKYIQSHSSSSISSSGVPSVGNSNIASSDGSAAALWGTNLPTNWDQSPVFSLSQDTLDQLNVPTFAGSYTVGSGTQGTLNASALSAIPTLGLGALGGIPAPASLADSASLSSSASRNFGSVLSTIAGAGGGGLGSLGKLLSGGGSGFGTDISGGFLGGSATMGSLALAGVGGGLVGGLLGNLVGGGDQNYGSTGGAIGATLGALTPLGPLGALLGGTAGGLLGGLVGSHTNAKTSPDIYDTQNFGSIIADLTGSTTANGKSFQETTQLSDIFGGRTGISAIEETLAQYGSANNAPAWLQPMFNQLQSTFGKSSTGTGTLLEGKNVGQDTISGAAGASSSPTSYQTLGTLLTQFATAYQQNGGASQVPTFSLTHTMPDYNETVLAATGSYNDKSGQFSAATQGPTAAGIRTTGQGNITINVSGVVGNASDVAQAISTAMRQLNNGQLPGGYAATSPNAILRSPS